MLCVNISFSPPNPPPPMYSLSMLSGQWDLSTFVPKYRLSKCVLVDGNVTRSEK